MIYILFNIVPSCRPLNNIYSKPPRTTFSLICTFYYDSSWWLQYLTSLSSSAVALLRYSGNEKLSKQSLSSFFDIISTMTGAQSTSNAPKKKFLLSSTIWTINCLMWMNRTTEAKSSRRATEISAYLRLAYRYSFIHCTLTLPWSIDRFFSPSTPARQEDLVRSLMRAVRRGITRVCALTRVLGSSIILCG